MHIDTSLYPFIYLRMGGPLTDEECAAYLEYMHDVAVARGGKAYVFSHAQYNGMPSSQQRQITSDSLNKISRDPRLGGLGGTVVLLDNKLSQLVVTAVYWLAPPTYPTSAHATLGAAVKWMDDLMRQDNVHIPQTASEEAFLAYLDKVDPQRHADVG